MLDGLLTLGAGRLIAEEDRSNLQGEFEHPQNVLAFQHTLSRSSNDL
jgi:hypothetical protein